MLNKRDAYVIGVGMTPFGRHEGQGVEELGQQAVTAAVRDSGVDGQAVEISFCGHVLQGVTAGQRVLGRVGMTGVPVINVENACASGSTAFFQAVMAVRSGMVDVALALGIERMGRGPLEVDRSDSGTFPKATAAVPLMPSLFAEVFRAHAKKYGTTVEQMAMVSVKNHHNGALNPNAHYGVEVSVADVLAARMVADPLTLLMCCPTSSGAAAAIVASGDIARGLAKKPIAIVAAALQSEKGAGPVDPLSAVIEINARAARKAYEEASITPDKLDLIELHDCFAIAEIIHYENLGLCERGEGGRFIEQGQIRIGGKVAVSPSGGLLAKGHPLGATGVAQVFEVVTQLRGEAGPRQVAGAKIGLTHCQGFGGAVGVHILAV